MNARLLRCTIGMTVLPFSGVMLILAFQHDSAAVNLVLILATLIQLPVVLLCKRAIKPFIRPDAELLTRIGVASVPAAYEPGKFKIDARIASVALWISLIAPFLAWLAIHFPQEVTVSVLNFATYVTPSMSLLVPSLMFVLVGAFALPFWFQTSRANAMYSEGSERKRYLLRGFVDRLEQTGSVQEYISAYKGR